MSKFDKFNTKIGILQFWYLCAITRSYAGSRKIFLDKQSETCQKFSSLEDFYAGGRKTQKS